MFHFHILVLVGGLLCGYGEAACSSHSECVTFATVTSDRRYCCGGTFCCTFNQYQMGVTDDPFTSMSIPGIVGIVAGILVFLSICGIILYCLMKGSNKGSLNRTPKNSHLEDSSSSDLRLEATSARPGRAVPVKKKSPDYDYPPDAFDALQPQKHHEPPPPYPHKKHTIPTVIGTFDGPFEYSRKQHKSRYAYDGPAVYDSDESEYRYHSRKGDYSFDREHRSGDRYRRDEDSHGRRYHRDDYSRDHRHHRDEYSRDRRCREDDYSYHRRYDHVHDRRY